MPRVTVELPAMIANVLDGLRRFEAEGATVKEALADAFAKHPKLRVHLVDESGAFRQHVLCFHNDVNTRWEESLDRPVADGDRLTILQAVSGG